MLKLKPNHTFLDVLGYGWRANSNAQTGMQLLRCSKTLIIWCLHFLILMYPKCFLLFQSWILRLAVLATSKVVFTCIFLFFSGECLKKYSVIFYIKINIIMVLWKVMPLEHFQSTFGWVIFHLGRTRHWHKCICLTSDTVETYMEKKTAFKH